MQVRSCLMRVSLPWLTGDAPGVPTREHVVDAAAVAMLAR